MHSAAEVVGISLMEILLKELAIKFLILVCS